MWQPRLGAGAALKYLGIVEALEADIGAGRIARGERLPPQRAIAEALGVDLTTVTRAFNEARRRGLVAAHAGRGTFISAGQPRPDAGEAAEAPAGLIDLGMNIPSPPAGIDLCTLIPRDLARLMAGPRGPFSLHYQDSAGAAPDREAAALWLGPRVERPGAERIVVTAGAQAALHALCALLLKPGDDLAASALTYPGLKAIAAAQGLNLIPLAMDDDGILPEAFERACRERAPRALYLVPAIDNPTTATLPLARRQALAATARHHGVAIIEDDPYSPLLADDIPPVAAIAGEITWHIATLAKCATPALRTAYVVAPGAGAALRLAGMLRASVLMAPPLLAALASRWIRDGTLAHLGAAIRRENEARQALAAALLAPYEHRAAPGGHHLWLPLPAPWRAVDFADHAGRAGISIAPAAAFALGPAPEAVRLSLGVAPDRDVLEDGLLRLLGLLNQPPALSARAVV
ncbi:PLP-dependent aminotransferase family protein [Zavarzinia compransoris]|uniref:PLP-dependent aminotransferase family protein n=1 Tax=Zavarzinia compransoris TaxID=1264899 RepID=A0A317EAA0_9PROT|nr:PLP-dependent aminotransferase family protein [Zavarzinia compransoris]PWR23156.1 PLP-dependent aminotransferase family protein [Zavarzinia compransoris]TDP46287.1 GntR family transcriptional regulator [Zavarzinia compransoris]